MSLKTLGSMINVEEGSCYYTSPVFTFIRRRHLQLVGSRNSQDASPLQRAQNFLLASAWQVMRSTCVAQVFDMEVNLFDVGTLAEKAVHIVEKQPPTLDHGDSLQVRVSDIFGRLQAQSGRNTVVAGPCAGCSGARFNAKLSQLRAQCYNVAEFEPRHVVVRHANRQRGEFPRKFAWEFTKRVRTNAIGCIGKKALQPPNELHLMPARNWPR